MASVCRRWRPAERLGRSSEGDLGAVVVMKGLLSAEGGRYVSITQQHEGHQVGWPVHQKKLLDSPVVTV